MAGLPRPDPPVECLRTRRFPPPPRVDVFDVSDVNFSLLKPNNRLKKGRFGDDGDLVVDVAVYIEGSGA